jgi:hypothetical protein
MAPGVAVTGEIINNYRLSSVLGQGGMGTVYLAEHSFMGRRAAVKVLRREFAEARAPSGGGYGCFCS